MFKTISIIALSLSLFAVNYIHTEWIKLISARQTVQKIRNDDLHQGLLMIQSEVLTLREEVNVLKVSHK